MIDLKAFRENPAYFEKAAKRKGVEIDGNHILSLDKKVRDLKTSFEDISAQKNAASKDIASAESDTRDAMISQMREIDKKAEIIKEELVPLEIELESLLIKIPNPPLDDVPDGKDESENVEVKRVGEPRQFDFPVRDHIEIGTRIDGIDTKKAAQVSGARFAYIKNGVAQLQMALMNFTIATLTNEEVLKEIAASAGLDISTKPFQLVFPPVMITPEAYTRMARLSADVQDERYYLQKDNLYLIGSAEHTLGPMHMDEIIPHAELPIRYLGYSTSFRREAGSYGKDTKGIIRQHQFDKLEMESFTVQGDSLDEQHFLVAIQEYLVEQLEIPYRTMLICTGDMGSPDARQIDIECWIPSQETYRETHSADHMTDFQSRTLNTRYKDADGTHFVHMNDATAFAIGRTLVAILENYQQEDGSVEVPKVLKSYMGGIEVLNVKQ